MLADLLDLVLPRTCCGCGDPGRTLCSSCLPALAATPVLHRPDPCPPGLPALAAVAPYAGVVRSALLAHKEQGRLALAAPLGAALASAVLRVGGDLPAGTVLVPVPSDPVAVRERGHDHARRLARVAARHLGLPTAPLLVGARARGDQAGLDRTGRAANLDGALRARRALAGRPVVVVDDLVTTGATLAEAARALRAAGADVRGAAVVGATARRRPSGVPSGAVRGGQPDGRPLCPGSLRRSSVVLPRAPEGSPTRGPCRGGPDRGPDREAPTGT